MLIKNVLLSVLLAGVGVQSAIASCSTNNGDCALYRGSIPKAGKEQDFIWDRKIENKKDHSVERLDSLLNKAKRIGESALGVALNSNKNNDSVDGIAETWCMTKDMTLSNNMQKWVSHANWNLQWNSDYDYPIKSDYCISGSFQQAIGTVAKSYMNAQHILRLDVYPKQSMIVFSTK